MQLLLNVVLLVVVGAAGLSTQRALWRRRSPDLPLEPGRLLPEAGYSWEPR